MPLTGDSASGFAGGVATGIGSWPGTDPREAARVIVGELEDLPHLVELPGRGVGADMIGRAGAILVDLHFDLSARSYRFSQRPTKVSKRAHRLLADDADAFDEAWEVAGRRNVADAGSGTVKVQVAGPLTLAAEVELSNGHRALTDRGALAEIADSLAEGVPRHVRDIARRTGAQVVVQLDEPQLGPVVAGALRGVTSMDVVRAVPAVEAAQLLNRVIDAAGVPVLVHDCGTPQFDVVGATRAAGFCLDVRRLAAADLDKLAELVDRGLLFGAGLLAPDAVAPTAWRDGAGKLRSLLHRLGFALPSVRTQILVTPACGLAGASPASARAVLRYTRDIARSLHDD